MKPTKNLRVELHPYPHLRDDDGCVLANDYVYQEKIDYILYCVAGGNQILSDLEEISPGFAGMVGEES